MSPASPLPACDIDQEWCERALRRISWHAGVRKYTLPCTLCADGAAEVGSQPGRGVQPGAGGIGLLPARHVPSRVRSRTACARCPGPNVLAQSSTCSTLCCRVHHRCALTDKFPCARSGRQLSHFTGDGAAVRLLLDAVLLAARGHSQLHGVHQPGHHSDGLPH